MSARYIVVWRRSPTARYLDVETDANGDIAVYSADDTQDPVVTDEEELVRYINSTDSHSIQVEVNLAHKILGWSIP